MKLGKRSEPAGPPPENPAGEARKTWRRELPAGTLSVPVTTVANGIHNPAGSGSTETIDVR